jgi:hypothetical protein
MSWGRFASGEPILVVPTWEDGHPFLHRSIHTFIQPSIIHPSIHPSIQISQNPDLEVVEQAFRERGVWVEVDQVRCLLGLEESDSIAVLLYRHTHLREHRLPSEKEKEMEKQKRREGEGEGGNLCCRMESARRTFASQVSVNSATSFSFSCSWSTASCGPVSAVENNQQEMEKEALKRLLVCVKRSINTT